MLVYFLVHFEEIMPLVFTVFGCGLAYCIYSLIKLCKKDGEKK